MGQLGTNCYLVEDGGEVGIIDPGDAGDFIIRKITDLESKPVWIMATHGHFDHIMAASELALAYQIPFYIHPQDEFLLSRAKESAEYFTGVSADPILVKPEFLSEDKKISLGNINFEIIETPGHTPGGVCLYSQKGNILFCGDLVFFGGGVGRTDFKYSSEEDLHQSIEKILKLPEETVVYPGHGEKTSIEELKHILGSKKLARSEFL